MTAMKTRQVSEILAEKLPARHALL